MELQQAIDLIGHPVLKGQSPQVWADLGCGDGLFTRALGSVLPAASTIYAVDQNKRALQQLPQQGQTLIKPIPADFVKDMLPFAKLDGILMANALHFVQHQQQFIKKLEGYLGERPRFIMVEYDTDVPNRWVPYPLSFTSLQQLFSNNGYTAVQKIHEQPSLYGRAKIYSVLIEK